MASRLGRLGRPGRPGTGRARRDPERIRLSVRDTVALAVLGPRTRPVRAVLSALGVAVGIAALVAITGAASSQQAQIRADLDAMGANLLVVQPGAQPNGSSIDLPEQATDMISRIAPVQQAAAVRELTDATVFRTDLVPETYTGGITAVVADRGLLDAVDLRVAHGRWFDDAAETLPTVVLGSVAAQRLGITDLTASPRIRVGDQWFGVIGILEQAGLAAQVDTSAFVAGGWAATDPAFTTKDGDLPPVSQVYVRTSTGTADQVRSVLAATANPANPTDVKVSRLSDLSTAQDAADGSMSSLVVGLAAIALLVGGIGIANTMVVAVMERRGEIGLRRALGARTGQVTEQFLLEAVVLAALGGLAGTLLGVLVVVVLTTVQGSVLALDPSMLAAGPAAAVVVGALAGIYPATRAARQPPNAALRAV